MTKKLKWVCKAYLSSATPPIDVVFYIHVHISCKRSWNEQLVFEIFMFLLPAEVIFFNLHKEVIWQEGKKCHIIKRNLTFLFTLNSSGASGPVRPTLKFIVHDIRQICCKPHIKTNKASHLMLEGLQCCG